MAQNAATRGCSKCCTGHTDQLLSTAVLAMQMIMHHVVQCSHGSILCSRSAALVVRLTMLQLLTPTSYSPQSERGSQSILPLLFRPASRARYCLVHNVAKCDIDYVPSTGHARSYDTTSLARMACASFFRKPCRPCPLLLPNVHSSTPFSLFGAMRGLCKSYE